MSVQYHRVLSSEEYELHSRKIIKMLDGSQSCQILYLPNPSACCKTWTNKKKTMTLVSVKIAGTPSGSTNIFLICLLKNKHKTHKQRFKNIFEARYSNISADLCSTVSLINIQTFCGFVFRASVFP